MVNSILLPIKFVAFCAILITFGCGLKNDFIEINYRPIEIPQHIDKANLIEIKIVVFDKRNVQSYVCRKFESERAGRIIAKNDLKKVIEQAIMTELGYRGFKPGGEKVIVSIRLIKFMNKFELEGAVGEVIFDVLVKNVNNKIFFSKIIAEINIRRTGEYLFASYAKESLEQALQGALKRIFNDPEFINALFVASKY